MHARSKKVAVAAVAVGSLAAGAGAFAAAAHHGKTSAAPVAGASFAAAKSGAAGPLPDGMHGHHGDLTAAAAYLGLTDAALQTQLESGKTLAQVAAATNGKSTAGLIDALVAAEQKELAAGVTAGRITQAQSDALSANLAAHVSAEVNGRRGPGFGRGHGEHGGPGDHLAGATAYLGIGAAQLQTQLESGKTLAQVAQATDGKTVAGLVAALVAAEKKELAAAVSAGRLTQAQSDAFTAGLEARVTAMVNGTFGPRGDHHGGGADGDHHDGADGDHDGPPSGGAPVAPASTGASL